MSEFSGAVHEDTRASCSTNNAAVSDAAKAQAIVDSGVWAKAERSAGLKTRFSTNATDLWVHWYLQDSEGGDWLWPPTGHAGVDIYIEDEGLASNGIHQRWAGSRWFSC